MRDPINILFLCIGNSCRSQMAEGWARALGGDRFIVQSAGIEAHGKNPRAIAAMATISLFGLQSGAALVAVVGVLVEVPVMLSVVWIVNRSKGWYEARA